MNWLFKIVQTEFLTTYLCYISVHYACNVFSYCAGGPGILPDDVDIDGFPPIGARLIPGQSTLYVYTHAETKETTIIRYKDGEQIAFVEAISLHGCWSQVLLIFNISQCF